MAEVVHALEGLLVGVSPNEYVVPGAAAGLRLRFTELLKVLRMSHVVYSPASLRRGSALYYFSARGSSLADLMYRGRWDSSRTLSRYLQEGFAVLATTLVMPAEAAVIRELAALWSEVLAEVGRERDLGPAALVEDLGHALHTARKVGQQQCGADA